ncbi:fasciclin domain-containing protein [Spirosoma sp. BT702]|uniref:Fasciclin domain-containing protein n=1 Tax=Spirosoma profusum TaxID=2771354 RepID=A0A927AVK5_9BACT|nr:fasciclin domain-containing protein [Spirosoma profusum]MBD2705209.1 fasciclin domain-containing protein [Spirosoma profusum]
MNRFFYSYFRWSTFVLLVAAAPFFSSCKMDTPDPTDTSTTPPGSGTTTPGSGTSTTPGSGTSTTPGSGTSTTPGTGTLVVVNSVEFIGKKSNLNFLEAAIARAGLASEFNNSLITIFAPSDDAFKAAGFASEAAIAAAPVADLQRVLRYHLVGSRIDQSSIPTAVNTEYQTALADNQVSVFKTSLTNISVNQAKIAEGDLPTTNGVVHVINQVLMPATANLSGAVKANNNLSFMTAAIERAGASVQDIINQSSKNGYTLFAPTNDAFKAAGYASEAAIKAADSKKIADLLLYHILKYRAYAQTFQDGADIVTAQGGSVRINVNGGKVTVTGKGNGSTAANVVQTDQIASNGIIQVIDRVLLPAAP